MGKTFVEVQVPTELTSIFVAECEDGCIAFVASEQLHYALYKANTTPPNINQYVAADGAPIAGYPGKLPIWKRLLTGG